MELPGYLAVLRRWWWLVLAGTVLAGGIGYFVNRSFAPVYRTSATLFINFTASPTMPTYSDALLNQLLVKTYSQMISQPVVLEKVQQRLGLPDDVGALQKQITVLPVRDTQLLELTVEANDPALARDIANAAAEAFIEQQRPYFPATQAAGAIQIAQPALLPLQPVGPRVLANTGLAALVGLLVMLGIVALREYLDDSLHDAGRVLEASGLLTLGTIPLSGDRRLGNVARVQATLVADGGPRRGDQRGTYEHGSTEEAFRLLRANVQFMSVDQPLRSLIVTSAGPGDGKTTTAANLAAVLAQAGQRVILVDADLRRPTLHVVFGVPNRQGLSNLLLNDEPLRPSMLRPTHIENLCLLPSGPLPPNPSQLLASARMQNRLLELCQQADRIVIDTPPALLVSDPVLLAQSADGVILVADARTTSGSNLNKTRLLIEQAGGRVLGVSLNKLQERRGRYGDYYQTSSGEEDGHGHESELASTTAAMSGKSS